MSIQTHIWQYQPQMGRLSEVKNECIQMVTELLAQKSVAKNPPKQTKKTNLQPEALPACLLESICVNCEMFPWSK